MSATKEKTVTFSISVTESEAALLQLAIAEYTEKYVKKMKNLYQESLAYKNGISTKEIEEHILIAQKFHRKVTDFWYQANKIFHPNR